MSSASRSELHPRRLEEAVGYYYGELSPRERSSFEKHLKECAACTRAVATAEVIFPAAQEVLAVPPPRLTTDELLTRMEFERRRIAAGKRAPIESPAGLRLPRRWLYALAPALATTVLWMFRVSLFTGPGFLLASPKRPGPARPSAGIAQLRPVHLYAAGPGDAIRPLPTGGVLDVAGDGTIHLWIKGEPSDHEVLLATQDALGRLTALWPGGDGRRGAPCPGGCDHFELTVDVSALPSGTMRAVLWLGPGPLDASGLTTLGNGEPRTIAGARASTWFTLKR